LYRPILIHILYLFWGGKSIRNPLSMSMLLEIALMLSGAYAVVVVIVVVVVAGALSARLGPRLLPVLLRSRPVRFPRQPCSFPHAFLDL